MSDVASTQHAIATRQLGRVYRQRHKPDVVALAGVTLLIPPGEIHGLLGPNGAGKSTLMRILSTVLLPTSGDARILGHDVVTDHRLVKRLVAVVFGGDRGLYPRLSARHNLRYWAALYQLTGKQARHRTEALLEELGLAQRADEPVETYSTGMRQRLHLARGLIAQPRVLLLDEPTNGLDPVAAHQLRRIIRGIAEDGRTVLLATHDMVEAEAICDRVTMINSGRIIASAAPRQLAGWLSRYEQIEVDDIGPDVVAGLKDIHGVTGVDTRDDGSVAIAVGDHEAFAEVLRRLVAAGATSIRTGMPSLEDVYLRLLGDEPPEPPA